MLKALNYAMVNTGLLATEFCNILNLSAMFGDLAPGCGGGGEVAQTWAEQTTDLNPTGWFRFDETSGVPLLDSSGNGNDADWVSTPIYAQPGLIYGDASTAAVIDGVNDYGQVRSNDAFGMGTDDFFAEVWIDDNAQTTGNFALFDDRHNGTGAQGWMIAITNGVPTMFANHLTGTIQTQRTATTSIADGEKHHIIFNFERGAGEIWVDGVEESTGQLLTALSLASPSNAARIGNRTVSTSSYTKFGGKIGELVIGKGTLITPEQVASRYLAGMTGNEDYSTIVTDLDPVWFFNLSAGALGTNQSTQVGSDDGTVTDVVESDGIVGDGGGLFNGVTSMILVPADPIISNFGLNNFLTLETIVKLGVSPPAATELIMAIGVDTSTNTGWHWGYRNDGKIELNFFTNGNWLRYTVAAALFPNDEWFHLVFTWKKDDSLVDEKAYVNGFEVATVRESNFTGTPLSNSFPLILGGRYVDGTPPLQNPMAAEFDSFVGYEDFSLPMTATEIRTLAVAAGF